MHRSVAVGTKGHEVFFRVSAELAARFDMTYVQTFRASAGLAPPAIPPQDSLMELFVGSRWKAPPAVLDERRIQGAVPTCWRMSCRCSAESMPTSR
jgi:hypothetical protein